MPNTELETKKLIAKLLQEVNFLTMTINNLPHYIFWKNTKSEFLGCNLAFAKGAGFNSPADIIGKTDYDLPWDKEEAEKYRLDDQEVFRSGVAKLNYEETQRGADGIEKTILVSKVPIYDLDNKLTGLLGIYSDITDIRRAQKLAEVANKAKSEFLANLSHDLRTPLSSLVVLNEYLAAEIHDEKLKSLAEDARYCANRMLELIDEILEITEIESRNFQSQDMPFQLQQLVASMMRLMTPAAHQKNLNIQLDYDPAVPLVIIGKYKFIQRILINLLSNAIKFTEKGSITVSVQLITQQSEQLNIKLSVKDTGIGIPVEQQYKIFDKFERLTAAYEGNYQGFGLGLYIVKQFIEILNGRIEIDSAVNIGTTVHLEIPLKKASNEQIAQLKKQYESFNLVEDKIKAELTEHKFNNYHLITDGQAKILFVEDNLIAQNVGKMVLQTLNFQFETAETGKKAIELAKKNHYQLILLDIGLPDISGLEVAKAIRNYEINHSLAPVPIIALTAHVKASNSHALLQAGIQQILQKPITTEKAQAVLNNWLMKKQTEYAASQIGTIPSAINPPIDLSMATKIAGNKKLAEEMLDNFIVTLPLELQKIKDAFYANDNDLLSETVHKLNGAASYVGVPFLRRAGNSLEAALHDNFSEAEIKEIFDELNLEADKVLNFYATRAYLNSQYK